MLSVFPSLLAYGLFAPFLIRFALGAYFVYRAMAIGKMARRSPLEWSRAIVAGIGGALVLVGFTTQIGAIIVALWAVEEAVRIPENRPVMLLALAMALSLLFSGAGFLAFDLPL